MARIEEFLKNYSKRNTQRGYKTSLRHFFDVAYNLPRLNDDAHYEELADRYITELENGTRHLSNDVIALTTALNDNAPITARSRIAAVKEFFIRNGYDFSPVLIRDIRREIPKGYAQTEEEEMDRETLKKILHHCDVRARAIFLVLVSSGMRVGEVIQITLSDVDLEKKPAQIRIRKEYTKTRTARLAFISGEAVDAVREWLKVRTAHMASAENRNAGLVAHGLSTPKKKDDNRLFPYEYSTIDHAWETAIKSANLFSKDITTGRKQLHVHQLRKYFRTMAATKIPVDIAEALMGHAGYLTEAYRKNPKKQLTEYYTIAESALSIFAVEDPETRGKVATLTEENVTLRKKIEEIERRQTEQLALNSILNRVLTSLSPSNLVEVQKELTILSQSQK